MRRSPHAWSSSGFELLPIPASSSNCDANGASYYVNGKWATAVSPVPFLRCNLWGCCGAVSVERDRSSIPHKSRTPRKKQPVSFVLKAPRCCRRCLFVRKRSRCGMNAELEQAWFRLVVDGLSPEPRGRDTYCQHAGCLPGIISIRYTPLHNISFSTSSSNKKYRWVDVKSQQVVRKRWL